METEQVRIDNIRKECHENKFHSYGKSYVYGARVNKYERRLRIINFIGLVIPLSFGGYSLSFGTNSINEYVVFIGGTVLLVQLIFSAFALVFKWDDELAYSLEATRDHNLLSQDFKTLGQFAKDDVAELTKQYNILNEKLKSRKEQDIKHDLSDKERIKGMRWSLREFQIKCVSCGEVPFSMNKTDCPVCGKY